MPREIYEQRPTLYRWLFRLLPVGVCLTIGLVILGGYLVISTVNANSNRTRDLKVAGARQRQVSRALAIQNARQAQTIRLLCDRGYIMIDLIDQIDALIPAEKSQLRLSLRSDREALLGQLLDFGSPCVQP